MSNLTIRVLTAVIAGAASIALIWLHPQGMLGFAALVSALGLYEFLRITGVRSPVIYVSGLLYFASAFYLLWGGAASGGMNQASLIAVFYLLFLGLPLTAMALLFDAREREPVKSIALLVMGVAYVILPFWLWAFLGLSQPGDNHYAMLGLGIFFLIWATDIFAYFGGRFLGRHKLFERISPKKTWEGSLVGAAACLGTGFLLQALWPLGGWDWRVAAAIVAPVSQLGDLAESMFKRSLSLKDSGGILPGHGGILDRFDGFLISMPFLAFYFYWMRM